MENFDYRKYLAENKLNEAVMDVATVAQAVADAFTADDELGIKYVVTPGSIDGDLDLGSFDLDAEAGPNTPGEDWKDEGGFGIDYYLGKYAGGSFLIKKEGDGSVVYNAAMRNAVIAYIENGEIDMVYNQENHYNTMSDKLTGMKEAEEAKKSNKMKKSELKELIKSAFMAETTGAAIEAEDYDPVMEADVEEGLLDFLKKKKAEAPVSKDDSNPIVGVDYNGNYIRKDGTIAEAEEVDTETTDAEVETPEGDAEIETTDVETTAEVSPDVKTVQDALTQAMEAAKALGDNKLEAQIGNTITFFTRAHVANTETDTMAEADEMEEGKKEYYKDAEADDAEHIKALEKDMEDDKDSSLKLGEVMFPMWTKIQK